jgi:signal peptidase II
MAIFMTLLAVAVLVIVDQLVKLWAVTSLASMGSIPLIPGVLQLTYVENRGAAFSLLENHQGLFIAFAFVVIAVICLALYKKYIQTALGQIALVLICAGAVGNLIDRIFRHFVVDMIHFSLINFPVFNVADIFVCVGVALFFYYVAFQHKDNEEKDEKKE